MTLIRKDWRERFPAHLGLISEAATLIIAMLTIWYTSKAFQAGGMGAYLQPGIPDYFHYLVWAEISLFLPLGVMATLFSSLQQWVHAGMWDEFMMAFLKPLRGLAWLSFPIAASEIARLGVWVLLACFAFGFQFTSVQAAGFLLFQLAALPAFVGLGWMSVGIWMRLGRGSGAVTWISSLGALLGGAYFPVSMFPSEVSGVLNTVSPFNLLLEGIRTHFLDPWGPLVFQRLSGLLVFGFVVLATGAWAVRHGVVAVRKRGSVIDFN